MYAFHVQRIDLRVRYELESVQNLLHNQYAQYKQARDAVELINYKYHDLKHHIIALRAEESGQAQCLPESNGGGASELRGTEQNWEQGAWTLCLLPKLYTARSMVLL